MSNTKSIECILVTANCGSVFEDPTRLLVNWTNEFLSLVEQAKPKFIALHLQEVGGKTYEKSMEYVQQFIKILCESPELKEYKKTRIFLDEDYNSAEHFTALGNLYFAHECIQILKIWNFSTFMFEDVENREIHTGNIESITTKEKAKFPQKFFPECKWSRKGFLRTRWNIEGTTLDFINIHLFHDASNLASCMQFPSVYCKSRRRALVHTLERIHKDPQNGLVPFFMFGDFNFRCDTEGVVKKLTSNLIEQKISHIRTDHSKVIFKDSEGSTQLIVGKKEFSHKDDQIFKESWLKEFDRELEPLKDILFEFPIKFNPTYPFEEDPNLPHNYMPTRCPSWCDRILMTKAGKKLIKNEECIDYDIIGNDICMGDHKPVYLKLNIKSNQGIVNICDHLQTKQITYNESNTIDLKLASCTCVICLNQLDKILNESLPLLKSDRNEIKIPMVSINFVNADNSFVCKCDSMEFKSKYTNELSKNVKVCDCCSQLHKVEPLLVSKKVVLGEVIVNRIDSQFLSTTYSSTHSEIRKLKDPYTPESIESHSPSQYELNGEKEDIPDFINITNNESEIINSSILKQKNDGDIFEVDKSQNILSIDHSVSPTQLQTRLEILKESQKEFRKMSGSASNQFSKKNKSLNTKCCFCCSSCIIL